MSTECTLHYHLGNVVSRRLPVELLHQILEQTDQCALAACSLTCRDWLELSRPYLFRCIKCYVGVVQLPCGQNDDSEAQPSMSRLEDLLEFLHTSPVVRLQIIELNIIMRRPAFVSLALYHKERYVYNQCSLQTLVEILRLLPRLKSLLLDGPVFMEPKESLTVQFPVIARLDSLTILPLWSEKVNITPALGTGNRLAYLLRLVGDVKTLVVRSTIDFKLPISWDPAFTLRANDTLRVHSLEISTARLLRIFQTLPHIAEIRSLRIACVEPGDGHILADLLAKTSHNLQRLEFVLHDPIRVFRRAMVRNLNYLWQIDYARLSVLEHLSLVVPVYGAPGPQTPETSFERFPRTCLWEPAYNTLQRCIPTLPASLKVLSFKLLYAHHNKSVRRMSRTGPPIPLLQTDFTGLDDVLARRIEGGLQIVEFHDAVQPYLPNAERKFITDALPRVFDGHAARFPQSKNL